MNSIAVIGLTVLLELIILFLITQTQNYILQLIFMAFMIAVIGLLPVFMEEDA